MNAQHHRRPCGQLHWANRFRSASASHAFSMFERHVHFDSEWKAVDAAIFDCMFRSKSTVLSSMPSE